jgi:RNA processing factor Prp31
MVDEVDARRRLEVLYADVLGEVSTLVEKAEHLTEEIKAAGNRSAMSKEDMKELHDAMQRYIQEVGKAVESAAARANSSLSARWTYAAEEHLKDLRITTWVALGCGTMSVVTMFWNLWLLYVR